MRHLLFLHDVLFRRGTYISVEMLTFMGLSTSHMGLELQVCGSLAWFESGIDSFVTPVGPIISGQVIVILYDSRSRC